MCNIQVNLPPHIVDKIDQKRVAAILKRGPMTRMILANALCKLQTGENLEFNNLQIAFSQKYDDKNINVPFEIPYSLNQQLVNLVNHCPLSKKKLAELLICHEVNEG